ncbi:AAA family ATPase [Corynebacterium felinum]|uniref:DNA repair exonuclease SbcCD ATPase subunit n=1 Tax=Corynebacterium felinum TaxID=131318 RepID=A0ABU2B9K1_9CORY|nr:AAA family ATPase [Corynebacterium felinum]MDF5821885.1 AAA family ATPase [Corynebacterium felinum]MDR7355302.1 DNA repair exonuclease SbcCD ATPase subunit [Corynebacterium felinum]WJY94655.1 chromosome segregation protein [Corynebacterium felinum]
MRIHEIEIFHFRGITHLTLTDLPTNGLIVISGPNEAGKSTILEAIDTALNTKSTSKASHIKEIKSLNHDEPPRVKLRIELAGHIIELDKQYLKSPKTLITIDNRTYSGEEAEKQLAQLKTEHIDDALYAAMFNRQDNMLHDLALAEIQPLEQVLRSHTSTNTHAEIDTPNTGNSLIDAALKEKLTYFTKNNRPTGILKEAEERLNTAHEQERTCLEALNQLENYVTEHTRIEKQRDLARTRLPELRHGLDNYRSELSEITELETTLTTATNTYEKAELALTHARTEHTRRVEKEKEIERLRIQVASHEAELEPALEKVEAEKRARKRVVDTRNEAIAHAKAARETLTALKNEQRAAQATHRLAENRALIKAIDELENEAEPLRARKPLAKKHYARLEAAFEKLKEVRIKVSVQATTLALYADDATTITLNGSAQHIDAEPYELPITSETSIVIGKVTARITPGAGLGLHELEKAEDEWEKLCTELDVDDLEHAKQRVDAESQLARINDHIKALLKSRTRSEIEEEIARDASEACEASGRSLDEINAEIAAAEETLTHAETQRDELDRELETFEQSPAQIKVLQLQDALGTSRAILDRETLSLHEEEKALSSTQLEENLLHATAAFTQARSTREEIQRCVDTLDPEHKRKLVEVAEAKVKNCEAEIRSAERELDRMAGYIEQATGVAADYDRARNERTEAQRRYEVLSARARAAALLYDVLAKHQRHARERYAEPFMHKLQMLGRVVFGKDVSFELSENLQVLARTQQGVRVSKKNLSGGAQEQVEILIRLAVSSLVAEHGLPVFFDDVLGSTDDERLDSMAAVFNSLSKKQQIFVLTCAPVRYQGVGVSREYFIKDLQRM